MPHSPVQPRCNSDASAPPCPPPGALGNSNVSPMAFAKTRAALEEAGAEKAAMQTEIRKLREQLADTSSRLHSSQGHNEKLLREFGALQKERDQLRAAAANGEALAKRLDDSAVRTQAVVQERDKLADTVRRLTDALRQKEDRCSELEERLKVRGAAMTPPLRAWQQSGIDTIAPLPSQCA